MKQPSLDARTAAALTVHAVIFDKRSLNDVLQTPAFDVQEKDIGLWRELSFGVVRWYWPLAVKANSLLRQPLKTKDNDVYCLILVGIYQLLFLRTAQHAAVNETVNAVHHLNKKWARSLVNALLRQTIRHKNSKSSDKDHDEAVLVSDPTIAITTANDDAVTALSHPLWLLQALQKAWPQQWADIAQANNARPSMTLRVNAAKTTRDQYLERLQADDIQAKPVDHLPQAVALASSVAADTLPGFIDGLVSVQDAGAQRAAELLDVHSGQRVLDACAAPGGKCSYVLENTPTAKLVAIDISETRLQRIDDGLKRLQLNAQLIAADAIATHEWWDSQPFDRILIDAPCSGTGVISRHPDIKHLRRESDIAANVERQYDLLSALWPVLAPGGRLLYVTCSVLPDENEAVVSRFLDATDDAHAVALQIPNAVERAPGYQCLPTADGNDGFFYAAIERQ